MTYSFQITLRNPLAEFEAVVVAAEIDAEDFPGHLLLGGLALHEGHGAEFLAFAAGELRIPERLDLSMLFVLIVLFISLHYDWRLTLLGFAPILLSWLIVLGAMVIFDVRFNLINIIISTFIFGIGVDYSIFVINGLTGKESRLLGYHKTAIFFSAVILIVTVSSMLIAVHPAIRSVGFSTLIGLLSAVILSYVVQPAVYRWLKNRKA